MNSATNIQSATKCRPENHKTGLMIKKAIIIFLYQGAEFPKKLQRKELNVRDGGHIVFKNDKFARTKEPVLWHSL